MAKARNVEEARRLAAQQVQKRLTKAKQTIQSRMVKEHMSGPTGPSSVSVRSGQLRRALDGVVSESGGKRMTLLMFFGGGVPYAKIHEYGGTVRPKNAQNLAIPVGDAKTRAGNSRHSGPMAIWTALRFIVNKKTGKKLLIDASTGRKQKIKVLFVLVPQVVIPARLNFGKTFKEEADLAVADINSIKIGYTT